MDKLLGIVKNPGPEDQVFNNQIKRLGLSTMIGYKQRSLTRRKPLMIVLTFVFILLLSFPALSLEPSKKFNREIHFTGMRETHHNTHLKVWKSIDDPGRRIRYSPIDAGRKIILLTKNYRKGYKNLSPKERKILKKRYQEWQSMPEERQEILRRRLKKWKQLSPEERQVLQQRFQQWQKLSPDDRKRTREKLQEWDRLPPGEKDRILQKFRGP